MKFRDLCGKSGEDEGQYVTSIMSTADDSNGSLSFCS